MARLTSLFVVVFLALVLLTFTQVEGRSRKDKSWHKRPRDNEKSEHHKKKEKDQEKGLSSYRNPWTDLWASYHDTDPLSFFNFRWNWESAREDPWWHGKHVCERETEEIVNKTETGSDVMRHFSTTSQVCDESETAYKCKMVQENIDGRKEVTIIYECCHGYTRQKGDFGCPQKVSLVSLLEKAEELGLTDFVKAVKTLKLTKEFEKGNFTVFVPVNGAFSLDSDLLDSGAGIILRDAPAVIAVSEPAIDKALKSLQNAILGHMVDGAFKSSSIEDEQLLKTGSPEDTTIRVNYFSKPEKLMTANCVPVISRDHMATNGVIHSVEKVLKPVTETLFDMVQSRPELSTLKTVLAAANYVSTLDQDGHLTLLAPTNAAFESMNSGLREKLLNGDRACLEKVLLNHLLPNVICTAAIQGQARTVNKLDRYANLTRSEDNKLFLDGAQIIQSDIMATNGVLHIIDEVLVPEEALSIQDLLQKKNYTEFLGLVKKAGLSKTLETSSSVTVFVPTNEAFQELPIAVKTKLNEDEELLRNVLTYHISPAVQECHRLHDNQQIPTLAGTDIRINTYSTFPYHHQGVKTAQCSPIVEINIDACNGRINVIKEVMMPPKGNVIDILALNKQYSTLVSLVKRAGIADALQGEGPFTVFAPTNEAFEKVGQETLDTLEKDPDKLQELLRRHVVEETLCCAGIFKRHWFDHSHVRTLAGDHLKLSRDKENRPKIGHAQISKCDQTATNGNVLEIDRVLMHEPPRPRWWFNRFSHWDDFF